MRSVMNALTSVQFSMAQYVAVCLNIAPHGLCKRRPSVMSRNISVQHLTKIIAKIIALLGYIEIALILVLFLLFLCPVCGAM